MFEEVYFHQTKYEWRVLMNRKLLLYLCIAVIMALVGLPPLEVLKTKAGSGRAVFINVASGGTAGTYTR